MHETTSVYENSLVSQKLKPLSFKNNTQRTSNYNKSTDVGSVLTET